ncbi:MAG TPA: chemotaxis protein CheA [Cyanobacteria bacterium UBA8803]|nr:chemotaxis protein CheA [Cyanobacteria bacterium UBA9273]HBL57447.1 chemotaxis protein CheA [Cyanobacteria bacterium UBA8803]
MSNARDSNNLFADFIDDYFAESEEHLTVIRRNLLALEPFVQEESVSEQKAIAPLPPTLLEELFRSFHSIKGLSGMVGIREAEQVAHEMESYLRVLRSQQMHLTEEGLDALISGTKMLELVIDSCRAQNPLPDIAPVIAQLAAVFAPDSSSQKDEEAKTDTLTPSPQSNNDNSPSPPPTPDDSSLPILEPGLPPLALKPQESERLATTLENGALAWRFLFIPEPSLSQRGINVNVIRQRLQSIGQIIHASPQVTANGGVAFNFVVTSQVDADTFTPWHEDGLTCTPYMAAEVRMPESPSEVQDSSVIETIPSHNLENQESSVIETIPNHNLENQESPSRVLSSSLSTPTSSNFVRVDLARLDELMQMVGELVIARARLGDNLKTLKGLLPEPELRTLKETNFTLERQLRDLREGVMRVRLVPIGETFARMQFVIRDIARESKKQIALELRGQNTEIDKFVVERMMDPLLHLVRNAVSHGLEPEAERIAQGKSPEGKIALRAATAGEMVVIEVEDDGRGVDVEKVKERARSQGLISTSATPNMATILDILCSSGFSTRDRADLTSGRGVGMAVVKNTVLELGGFLSLDTQLGIGTCFRIQLPLTLAIADALTVSLGGQTFAIPQSSVREVVELKPTAITVLENNQIFSHRGSVLPLLHLAHFFGLTPTSTQTSNGRGLHVVVIGSGLNAVGILVDRILGQREIVVRPLTDPLVQVTGIAGATELGDGRIVLILDTAALLLIGNW